MSNANANVICEGCNHVFTDTELTTGFSYCGRLYKTITAPCVNCNKVFTSHGVVCPSWDSFDLDCRCCHGRFCRKCMRQCVYCTNTMCIVCSTVETSCACSKCEYVKRHVCPTR